MTQTSPASPTSASAAAQDAREAPATASASRHGASCDRVTHELRRDARGDAGRGAGRTMTVNREEWTPGRRRDIAGIERGGSSHSAIAQKKPANKQPAERAAWSKACAPCA